MVIAAYQKKMLLVGYTKHVGVSLYGIGGGGPNNMRGAVGHMRKYVYVRVVIY